MKLFALIAAAAAAQAGAQVAPMSFEDGKQIPLAPGEWRYISTSTGSEARYGTALIIRCERTRRTVTIDRPGIIGTPLTIITSSMSRTLPTGGTISAQDNLLDAIAFSRGRILVSAGLAPVLAVPNWPEAARSIEDCRI